jgi:hypothetical protein
MTGFGHAPLLFKWSPGICAAFVLRAKFVGWVKRPFVDQVFMGFNKSPDVRFTHHDLG